MKSGNLLAITAEKVLRPAGFFSENHREIRSERKNYLLAPYEASILHIP